jgi:hypothetical protein
VISAVQDASLNPCSMQVSVLVTRAELNWVTLVAT